MSTKINDAQVKRNAAPIFVVGTPRSGTTLVASILGQHPDIFAPAPGETHYFHDVWTRRRELGDLQDEKGMSSAADRLLTVFGRRKNFRVQDTVDTVIDKEALLDRTRNLGGGYGGLYYAFTSMLAENEGKKFYCDDTPKHLFHLHTIFGFFPRAKVISCTRDPRDFLCSYKHYWKKADDTHRIKELYHPIITSLLWRGSTNLLLKHVNHCCRNRILLVRYETLVSHPREETDRICEFMELSYLDKMIDVESHNSSFEASSSGIFTTSVNRWHTCLESTEAWLAQTLTKNNMQALGYELESINPSKKALLLTLLETPLATVRALRANRTQTGPLLEYVSRRLSSLLAR